MTRCMMPLPLSSTISKILKSALRTLRLRDRSQGSNWRSRYATGLLQNVRGVTEQLLNMRQKNALNDADRLHILIEAEIAGGTRNPDAIDRLKQDLDLLRRIAKRLLPELNKSKHLWLPETQAQCNQLCDLAEKADVSWKEDGFQSDQLDYLLGVRLPAQQAASGESTQHLAVVKAKRKIINVVVAQSIAKSTRVAKRADFIHRRICPFPLYQPDQR